METFTSFDRQIEALAPAPRILAELLPLLRREEVNAQEVVDIIVFDPALTAKALRQCNTATLGGAEPVENISDAVTRLGFNEIYRLVAVAVGEVSLGAKQTGYGMERGDLWRHSAAVAVAARETARTQEVDEDTAFTCGLLHDVGKVLLSAPLAGAYSAVAKWIEEMEMSFLEAERSIFGVDHAELGGRVLEHWKFPETLTHAVRFHHDPAQAELRQRLAAITHLADLIAHTLGYGDGLYAHALRERHEAFEILDIRPGDFEILTLRTESALKASPWFSRGES